MNDDNGIDWRFIPTRSRILTEWELKVMIKDAVRQVLRAEGAGRR
jgi:hypothetical protein